MLKGFEKNVQVLEKSSKIFHKKRNDFQSFQRIKIALKDFEEYQNDAKKEFQQF